MTSFLKESILVNSTAISLLLTLNSRQLFFVTMNNICLWGLADLKEMSEYSSINYSQINRFWWNQKVGLITSFLDIQWKKSQQTNRNTEKVMAILDWLCKRKRWEKDNLKPQPHRTEASGSEIQIQVNSHVYNGLEKEKHTFSLISHVPFISYGLYMWFTNFHCQVTWDIWVRGPCTFGLEQWKWCWTRRQKTWVLILPVVY